MNMLWRWALVFGMLFSSGPLVGLAQETDRTVLNVLAPLGTLTSRFVGDFESDSKALVRTGFLSSVADTDGRVRQDSTVWDVVISDEFELRKLERSERLAALEGPVFGASPQQESSNLSQSAIAYFAPLFVDPLGLACKFPAAQSIDQAVAALRWDQLGRSLVKARVLGEVILDLSIDVQAILADAVVVNDSLATALPKTAPEQAGESAAARSGGAGALQGGSDGAVGAQGDTRVIFANKLDLRDPRLVWLERLYLETRPSRSTVDAEIFNPQVSCVITFYSRFKRLKGYFAPSLTGVAPSPSAAKKLHFLVPEQRTIVRRIGVAVTRESARAAAANRFAGHALRERGVLAASNGLCPESPSPEQGELRADCQFKILRSLDELPILSSEVRAFLSSRFRRQTAL
jgi:hypothetical protein